MKAESGLKERVAQTIDAVTSAVIAVPAVTEHLNAMQIASMIDHTILKADATQAQVAQLCQEAREYGFAAVCVNVSYVSLCREHLDRTETDIAAVVGFPLGATVPEVKAYEAQRAIAAGAHEVDMVIHVGALQDARYDYVFQDIATVVQACHAKKEKIQYPPQEKNKQDNKAERLKAAKSIGIMLG